MACTHGFSSPAWCLTCTPPPKKEPRTKKGAHVKRLGIPVASNVDPVEAAGAMNLQPVLEWAKDCTGVYTSATTHSRFNGSCVRCKRPTLIGAPLVKIAGDQAFKPQDFKEIAKYLDKWVCAGCWINLGGSVQMKVPLTPKDLTNG